MLLNLHSRKVLGVAGDLGRAEEVAEEEEVQTETQCQNKGLIWAKFQLSSMGTGAGGIP